MSVSTAIPLPEAQIAEICRRHGVQELAVFGSVLTEEFGPESDVDFLVTFENPEDLGPWLGRLTRLRDDLSAALGRPADVVMRDWLKWVIRDRVLSSAQVVHSASH